MQDVPSRPLGNRVDSVAPNAPELGGFGPFPVGVTTLHLRNPDQIDVLGAQGGPLCRHVRPLTVELWYPAAAGPVGCAYPTLLRDGKTPSSCMAAPAAMRWQLAARPWSSCRTAIPATDI